MPPDRSLPVDPEELGELRPVAYARSLQEAEHYRQLLEDHDIAAVVDEDYSPAKPPPEPVPVGAVAVLVPESMLEHAREVIDEFEDLDVLLAEEEEEQEDENDGYPAGDEEYEEAELEDEGDYPFLADEEDEEEEFC